MPSTRRVDPQDAQTALAMAMASVIGLRLFVDQEPGVIGACLAELMATFLIAHRIPDDLAHQERLRAEILAQWCDSVRELVAVQEMPERTQ